MGGFYGRGKTRGNKISFGGGDTVFDFSALVFDGICFLCKNIKS